MKTLKSNDILRYVGTKHQGSIIYNDAGETYYYYEFKNSIVEGYIIVNVEKHYNGKFIRTAYVNMKGLKHRIQEQKHYKNNIDITNKNIMEETKKAIKWLDRYKNMNWLSKKPRISKQIKNYIEYKDRIFTYNGQEYVFILSDYIPCLMDINPSGNEMFKIV